MEGRGRAARAHRSGEVFVEHDGAKGGGSGGLASCPSVGSFVTWCIVSDAMMLFEFSLVETNGGGLISCSGCVSFTEGGIGK